MTTRNPSEALAGVLEAIAAALRAMPAGAAPDIAVPIMRHADAPQPETAPAPPSAPAANDSEPAGETLADWLVTFRAILKDRGYSAQTLKNRGTCINYIDAQLGARPLRAIKPHEVATLLKKCSPHKAGRVLMELRDVYVEAIANGSAETNPAAHVKKPASPGIRKRLTLETWQAMFAKSKQSQQQWLPLMLLLGLHTGQRRADLAKMRFDDVVDGHLRVEQQKKARKKIGARLAIPLTLKLKATGLTLGQVIELCKTAGKPGATLLRQTNGRPIEMSSLSARFRELIVAVCGPDAYKQFEWPSLHEVRSLSARTYIAEGMPPATVQTLLGHAHAEMTAIYLNDRGLTEAEWKTVEVEPA
jgi:integrase